MTLQDNIENCDDRVNEVEKRLGKFLKSPLLLDDTIFIKQELYKLDEDVCRLVNNNRKKESSFIDFFRFQISRNTYYLLSSLTQFIIIVLLVINLICNRFYF